MFSPLPVCWLVGWFTCLSTPTFIYSLWSFCRVICKKRRGVHLPALLGTAGGRRVGALQGYDGGSGRMAGEGTGAIFGGGGGRLVGQVGVKEVGRGGGGGGGGGPRGLSRRMGNLDGSEWTGDGCRG